MDISTKAVKETTTIPLNGADGDPLLNENGKQCSITVYGPGSKPYIKAQAAKNQALIEVMRKGGKKPKALESREMDAEMLAACTISFNGFTYKDMDPGYEMFKAVYLDEKIGYIGEQVWKEIGDWENFI